MRSRRRFLCLLAALAVPARSLAQASAPARPKRVAILLGPSTAPDPIGPTRKAWAELFAKHGVVDSRDIEISIIRADLEESKKDRLQAHIATFRKGVALPADVIIGHWAGSFVARSLLPVSRGIPVVVWGLHEEGSTNSTVALNRRGENVTGVVYMHLELVAKQFELLREFRPDAKRVAVVTSRGLRNEAWLEERTRAWHERWTEAARTIGMEFVHVEADVEATPAAVVAALRGAQASLAVFGIFLNDGPDLWEHLARNGIAAAGGDLLRARNGALLGAWSVGHFEATARLAARVVRGQRAATIPVEFVREFGLAVNKRTARTLGIEVPQSILVRANEVFDNEVK